MDTAYWTLGPDLHRVGLVAPPAALRPGAALRGPQGRALLPALRHGTVEPRAGPARRLPRRGGRVGLRPAPPRRPATPPLVGDGRVAGGVDDDAVDPAVQHRGGREPRARSTPWSTDARGRRAGGRGHGGGRPRPGHGTGAGHGAGRAALRAPVRRPRPAARRRRVAGGAGRLRHDRGGHRPRAPGPGLRRGRPPDRPRATVCPSLNPVGPDGRFTDGHRVAGGPRRPGRQPRHQRPPGGGRPPDAARPLRALVPALLALPHPADLLGQAELVHRHLDPQGRPAGGQRHRGLAPDLHPGRPLR